MLLFSALCVLGFMIQQSEQNCLQVGNGNSLPSFQNYRNINPRITLHQQAIIPSYNLTCCGVITEWGVDVEPGGGNDDERYTIDFQVWRPSPTTPQDDTLGTGYYSLVGSNRFSSIDLSDSAANGLAAPYDIQFRPGDVLGFYVEEARDNNNKGVVVLTSASASSEVVWYASVDSQNVGGCVSAGSNGNMNTLLRGAPVISIDTSTTDCPRSFPTQPPCPTSTVVITSTTSTSTPQPTTAPPPTEPLTTTSDNPTTTAEAITTTPDEPTTEENPTTTESPTEPDTTTPDQLTTDDSTTTTENTGSDEPEPTTGQQPDSTSSQAAPVNQGPQDSTATIVAVVLVATIVIVIAIIVSLIIGITVAKKRTKSFAVTHKNLHLGIANQVYDQGGNNAVPTYDYVDDTLQSGKYNTAGDRIAINSSVGGTIGIYHEAVLYHAVGPSAAGQAHNYAVLESNEHIYEDDGFVSVPGGGDEQGFGDPLYEDPSASEPHPYEEAGFDGEVIYVPTNAERKAGKPGKKQNKTYNKLEFFVEEPVYWTPASTAAGLYSQLASKKYREISRNKLNVMEKLGSGEFGEVCKALWSVSGGTKEIAIKTLKPELPEEEKVRFLQEAAIMGQFSHPNVVKLYGVVTLGEPVMICLEFMANGDLRGYLCSVVPDKESATELQMQFLRFAKQIGAGMRYLAGKSFVHRDLAARNILLDEALNCKIGDFGMARDLVYETYYTPSAKGGKVPVKWMAPEALLFKKYSTDSDVWSYGMVLFEIWSVGKKPFSQLTNQDVLKKINTGYNQPPPPGCPRAIYKLMVDCWNPVHSKRPSFSDVCQYLSSSPDMLLQWVENSDPAFPRLGELGAPLSEAELLYKDMQDVYVGVPQ